MATTTMIPNRSSAPAAVGAAPVARTAEQIELTTRAECYLRLEEYVEAQVVAAGKRRADEENKLFKALCAIPENGASTAFLAQFKAFETAAATITNEEQQFQRFQSLVAGRIDALVR